MHNISTYSPIPGNSVSKVGMKMLLNTVLVRPR